MAFETKSDDKREQLANGMVRSPAGDKVDWTLIRKGPMYRRWAELLNRGAKIYGKNNWMQALLSTDRDAREKTKERFKESAARHFEQWLNGERDEDHAAQTLFNLNGYEAMLETDHLAQTKYDPKNVKASFNGIPLVGCVAEHIDTRTKVELLDKEIEQGFGQSAYKPGMEPR